MMQNSCAETENKRRTNNCKRKQEVEGRKVTGGERALGNGSKFENFIAVARALLGHGFNVTCIRKSIT